MYRSALFDVFFFIFAGARVVPPLGAETALTTTDLFGVLQLVRAVLMLFPIPPISVTIVVFVPLASGFNRSLETLPRGGGTVLPLLLRDLNIVFLCEIFHTLVSLFDARATPAIVSVVSATLALVLSCHDVSLSTSILPWIQDASSF